MDSKFRGQNQKRQPTPIYYPFYYPSPPSWYYNLICWPQVPASDKAHPDRQRIEASTQLNSMGRSLTTQEAASMLGIAAATLRDWKCQRVGPPYIQLSARCVRYSEADILKFAADRRVVPVVKLLVCSTRRLRPAGMASHEDEA